MSQVHGKVNFAVHVHETTYSTISTCFSLYLIYLVHTPDLIAEVTHSVVRSAYKCWLCYFSFTVCLKEER